MVFYMVLSPGIFKEKAAEFILCCGPHFCSIVVYLDFRTQDSLEDTEKTYNKDPYDNPFYKVYSETYSQKGAELDKYLINEQAKMISGQRPVSERDQMVEEWKARDGAELIREVADRDLRSVRAG